MGKVTIRKNCITYARKAARVDSTARIDGRSIFIKRYPGNNYRIIMVHVTEKQRAVRDMFADANRLAKDDMKRWNRIRHWQRYARKYKKLGAYRAAVSFYYKLIREHGSELVEISRNFQKPTDSRVFKADNLFFFVKFDSISSYRETLFRLAG